MSFLQFADKSVPYKVFLKDVAIAVVKMLKCQKDDPEYICQNRAFEMFGRANVERWRRNGLITPHKRPRKIEYLTAELRMLKAKEQDYLIS